LSVCIVCRLRTLRSSLRFVLSALPICAGYKYYLQAVVRPARNSRKCFACTATAHNWALDLQSLITRILTALRNEHCVLTRWDQQFAECPAVHAICVAGELACTFHRMCVSFHSNTNFIVSDIIFTFVPCILILSKFYLFTN